MGYVSGVFGVRGWIKLRPETEFADALFDYPIWYIGQQGAWRGYRFLDGKVQSKAVIAQLEGIRDRDEAMLLRGSLIAVPRDQLPQTEDDEFYWNDLIGLTVQNLEGETLGSVTRLMETGAHDVLVVEREGRECLIPFVSVYIQEVKLDESRMIVDWQWDD